MASRIMKILGILGSIAGIGIIMYGVTSYNNQKGLASALKGMFGTGDASHAISRMSDFKVVILIGIVLDVYKRQGQCCYHSVSSVPLYAQTSGSSYKESL